MYHRRFFLPHISRIKDQRLLPTFRMKLTLRQGIFWAVSRWDPTDGGPAVADGWNLNKKEIGRVIFPKGLMVSYTSCDWKVEGVEVVFLIAFDWGF